MAEVFKAPSAPGYHALIDSSNTDLQFCRLAHLVLDEGQTYRGETGDFETALVVLQGQVKVSIDGQVFDHVGQRKHVFDGRAATVYVPIHSEYLVEGLASGTQMAVAGVKAEEPHRAFLVPPDEVRVERRGRNTWQREVHDIIAENGEGRVHRLVIGETYGDAGAWSSYPPHKHDEVRDHVDPSEQETEMEEVYLYRLDPAGGFAVQLLYTEDETINEAHIVRDGDCFGIKRGYHPVVSAGGYRVYYLWFMAGAYGRRLKPFTQRQHRWVEQS
jgi:5-deoxy-glucuronate isomerase